MVASLNQSFYMVKSVRARTCYPNNGASVTLEIEMQDGLIIEQALFFGRTEADRSKALAFYYANGGKVEGVNELVGWL